jgi:integrase
MPLISLTAASATPHGLRGSFRMWCAENEVPREAAAICLAHKAGNEVEQSYQKSKLIEQRRKIMGRLLRQLTRPTVIAIAGCYTQMSSESVR